MILKDLGVDGIAYRENIGQKWVSATADIILPQ